MWLHAEISTLADIPRHWAAATPGNLAVLDADRALTYASLHERSDRVAAAIASSGIAPGSHIGLLAKNSAEFFELWFGAVKAGCALAPFNWRSSEAELTDLVRDAETPLLFAGTEFTETAGRVRAAAGPRVEVVDLGAAGAGLDDWLARRPGTVPSIRIHPEDIALLAYTSGTTGRPKGAQLSHRAFANWFLISSLEPTETWSAADVALMVMPNFHLAGSWVSLPALYHGGTIATLPAFEPEAFAVAVDRYQPTVTCLVPSAIALLLDHPAIRGRSFPSLRRLLYAGSPISPEALRRAIATFACDLAQFYGTSETYIITLLRSALHDPDDPLALASCGEPVPLVDTRITDAAGHDLPPGEVGEVLVRSPMMFSGYWNQPEATAAALTGGWYHTGDLGRRDPTGPLYLVDRLKDMIVTGGENVYSIEVEQALVKHPDVVSCAVVGVPDERWGERIVAYVIPRDGSAVSAADLLDHCRTLIAGYKVPKQICFTDALPMTSSGKIRKAMLRQQHRTQSAASLA
jgi:acyl-CoA synthetase (AMP-forming)/AMP-acid ligase II